MLPPRLMVCGKLCCSRCSNWMSPDQFGRDRRRTTGRENLCKACKSDVRRGKHTRPKNRKSPMVKAGLLVHDAIKRGKIIKPDTCQSCGSIVPKYKLDGHHFAGYDSALSVEWLCRSCHAARHHDL